MKKDKQKSLTKISQRDAVVWAVYVLGGDQRRLDTEDIAVKAHELTPGRFGWRKYPEQINLELVRVFLSDAKKREHGALISGSGRAGWSLTVHGLKWAASMKAQLPKLRIDRDRSESMLQSVDSTRRNREKDRLLATSAWARWSSGDRKIPCVEARELFRIDSYSDEVLRQSKVARLRGLFGEDPDLAEFLDTAAAALDLNEAQQ